MGAAIVSRAYSPQPSNLSDTLDDFYEPLLSTVLDNPIYKIIFKNFFLFFNFVILLFIISVYYFYFGQLIDIDMACITGV